MRMYAPPTIMLSFRVELPKLKSLSRYASANGVSRAGLIRFIVERFVRDEIEAGNGTALSEADRLRLMRDVSSPIRKRRKPAAYKGRPSNTHKERNIP
jgi:hypothetical protein